MPYLKPEIETVPEDPAASKQPVGDGSSLKYDPLVVLVHSTAIWEFPKIRGTLFGVLIIRILLCRVLY